MRSYALAVCLLAACGDDAPPRADAQADDAFVVEDAIGPTGDAASGCDEPPSGLAPCLGDGCEILFVASGDRHSCAIVRDGFVYCWGANDRRQLGDGTTCDRSAAVRAMSIDGVIEIAAGRDRTCARLRDGTAVCWGAAMPEPVPLDATDVTAVGVGDDHVCVIASERTRCFGSSTRGELGVVLADRSEALIDVALPAPARRLAVGGQHTCVRLSVDDAVACWGDDRFGQRGDGRVHAEALSDVATPAVPAPSALAAGRAHTCALLAGGALRCWGDATSGAIGAPASGVAADPRALSVDLLPGTVVAVAAHGDLTCFLLDGGEVACVGDGSRGQLGERGAPIGEVVVIAGVRDAVQVAPGSEHVCALVGSGEVICWGANDRGQLGHPTTSATTSPGAVLGLPDPDA